MAVTNKIQNQGVWIGAGFGTEDVATPFLTGQVGMVVIKGEKAYQLVQFKASSTAIAVGNAVMWTDYANFVVSAKVADATRNAIAGVALGTQTVGNYGWIQVDGPNLVTVSTGAITAGDTVIMSATDGTVAGVAAGTASTYIPLGNCTVTAAGNVVGLKLTVPRNGW